MKWTLTTVAARLWIRDHLGAPIREVPPRLVAAFVLEGTSWAVHRALADDVEWCEVPRPFVVCASGFAFPAQLKDRRPRGPLLFADHRTARAFAEGMTAGGYTDPRRQVLTYSAAAFAMGVARRVLERLPADAWRARP